MKSEWFVVCSERENKPVSRGWCATRADAERLLDELKRTDPPPGEDAYWLAEVAEACAPAPAERSSGGVA